MSIKRGALEQLIFVINQVKALSIGSSKESLPKEHLPYSLRAGDLYFGTLPDTTPEQQFLIRENLNACLDGLEQHTELAEKYLRLKQDYRSILESSHQEDFETDLLKNLTRFLGETKQFGVLDSSGELFSNKLSEHTVQIVALQLRTKDEHTVRVGRGELYACRYENFTIIVERDTPLSDSEKNHIKLTVKYISLQRTQNLLQEAMAHFLEEEENKSDTTAADNLESSLQTCLDNLVKEATIDPLTLAYNRRYLLKHVENLSKEKKVFSVIITDIDHFKMVNDTHGHEMGDQVLCEFVNILSDNIRDEDVIARWGGEEFLIVLESAELETAVSRAEAMRKDIENYKFKTGSTITASFGVATSPVGSEYFKELVKTADNALYRAKDKGRNRVEFNR